MSKSGIVVFLVLVAGVSTIVNAQCCETVVYVEPVSQVEYFPAEIVWESPVVEWTAFYPPMLETDQVHQEVSWNTTVADYYVDPCECVCSENVFLDNGFYGAEVSSFDVIDEHSAEGIVMGEVVTAPATYTSSEDLGAVIEPVASEEESFVEVESNEDGEVGEDEDNDDEDGDDEDDDDEDDDDDDE